MAFNVLSKIEEKISTDIKGVKNLMPGGKIPEAPAIAELKGTVPSPKTLKSVFTQGAQIPDQFQGEFKIEDPLTVLGIPQLDFTLPNLVGDKKIGFNESELKIEPPINPEGLTEEQIEEEEAKRKKRQKRNEKAKEIKDKLKGEAASFAQNLIPGAIAGAQANIVGKATEALTNSPLGGIMARVAAYKYFKAQLDNAKEKTDKIKEKQDQIKEKNKDGLKGGTKIIETGKALEGIKTALQTAADSAKAATNTMKPTFPSHPGPGNRANSEVSQKTREARDKAEGFAKNLKQTLNNVGKFLKDIIDIVKNLLKTLLAVIGMLLAMGAWIMFLKMLLELLFLLFLKKDSKANSGPGGGQNDLSNPNNQAQTPEEFLSGIGFPGYGDVDYSNLGQNPVIDRPLTPTRPGSGGSDGSTFDTSISGVNVDTGIDPFEPIMLGPTQIGIPLTPEDLLPTSGKDFNNHPLLGDLSGINNQIINELYEDGILSTTDETALDNIDPTKYSDQLADYYDSILEDFKENNQIEYIEHIRNAGFQLIGYRRYRA